MTVTHWISRISGKPWFSTIGRSVVPLDLALQRKTRGRVGLMRVLGVPHLLLTTTGRRTEQQRSVPLQYLPFGGEYVVVASNWGKAQHTAWSGNLLANPDAVVSENGRDIPVRARLLSGEERERAWQRITEQWPAYDDYAERAGNREIRLFALAPEEGSRAS
jgi:deazaflavin-dependent oxidoreductase (nitroreductase family)